MPSSKGWIKLYRDITEHWVYADPLLLKMWITIICTANHELRKIVVNNEMMDIKRGQFWTSIRKLALKTGMTRKTVEAKLTLLMNDGMIFVDSRVGVGTLITVRNYERFQGFFDASGDTAGDTHGDTQGDNVETLRGTLNTHKQEYKNDKALLKNGKNNGLPPDDPDFFEEV